MTVVFVQVPIDSVKPKICREAGGPISRVLCEIWERKLSQAQMQLFELEPVVSEMIEHAESECTPVHRSAKKSDKHPGRQELPSNFPRRVPHRSFFEGWDSTVVSRVGFLADFCSALVRRVHR
jgi:hypothetical protein